MGFTHLHLHTEYSLLDGAARIKKLVAKAKALGMKSLAITDHGVMFGVVDFWRECEKNGINGIIGCEVYTARRKLTDKDATLDKGYGHLILLAKNNEGYKNLTRIVSRGFTEGFYYKPRVDKDILRKYSNGLICLSACLAGDIPRHLLNDDYEAAKVQAEEYIDIFGKENFFLELQDHGLEEQYKILPMMKQLSEELDIPLVATNDVHYVEQSDAKVHDVLLCIQTASTVDETQRMKFPNDQFYLKSEEEMKRAFSHTPQAVENTQIIADMCRVEMDFGNLRLPDFKAPNNRKNDDYLRELCFNGLYEKYDEVDEKLKSRLSYELEIIKQMGYVEYFLIVWDFIKYAKENHIAVGPGRGSAAGSLVSYTLSITDIDPIKYNLIFERFLNPERVSMPDIDIDFCYERRQEVIDYVVAKYGKDKVSQIITFGTMKAKAAIRDVGRALNVSYKKTDDIAKAVPNNLGMTIEKALNINPELKQMYENDNEVSRVISTAMAIEGMPRHASTHAAGVVISKESIDEFVPLYLSDKGISTQFPMTTIEELGLLKMDFLGLRNLTVIRDARDLILKHRGVAVDFKNSNYDDEKVYSMISSGNTQGVFQLESGGMTQFMKNLKPDCFEDIVAGISLYRPGPMASIPTYIENKRNPQKVTYLHPKLEEILSVTYGCLVYQEQVMQIVRDLAGYTYGRSDILRRAMGKKKMDVMLAEKEEFISGCEKNNIDKATAEAIFNQMVTFAEYGFNKSHAVGYAVLGYETAYLKAHYPQEYMAALMTSVINDGNQVSKYIRNCKEMNIEVLPPDVNKSEKHFTIEDGKIRFGLLGIKNVGEAAIDSLIVARKEKGTFNGFFDFIKKQDTSKLNKKALFSLIKSGALDSIYENRASMIAIHEKALENAQRESRNNIAGQMSLLDMGGEVKQLMEISEEMPNIKPLSKRDMISFEKEMTGVYITGHPLDEYEEAIKEFSTSNSDIMMKSKESITDGLKPIVKHGDKVVVSGIISSKKNLLTKKNQMMAFLSLEDLFGIMEIVVFPKTFEKYHGEIEEDKVVVVGGSVAFEDEREPKILADYVMDIDTYKESRNTADKIEEENKIQINVEIENRDIFPVATEENKKLSENDKIEKILNLYERDKEKQQNPLKLRVDEGTTIDEILNLLLEDLGEYPVYIYKDEKAIKVPRKYWSAKSRDFIQKLICRLGRENVKY